MKFDPEKLFPGDLVGVTGKRGTYRYLYYFEVLDGSRRVMVSGPVTTGTRPGHDHRTVSFAASALRAPGRSQPQGNAPMHAGLADLSHRSKGRRRG